MIMSFLPVIRYASRRQPIINSKANGQTVSYLIQKGAKRKKETISTSTSNVSRFLSDEKKASGEDKFSYVPFGAGRHRCIGEFFAYVQIKTIWSVLLRKYEFELVNGHFPEIDFETMIHTPKNPFVRYKTRGDVANVVD